MYTTGFGDYIDADGNLVASNIDTPEGSPSPIPTISQGPVVNAPSSPSSGLSTASLLAIVVGLFVTVLIIGAGGRR